MVRINLLNPKALADQHLIAEYNEILMLLGYVKKYPEIPKNANSPDNPDIPKNYCLGKGHIKFFKNKLLYLKKRHSRIKNEMKLRGFMAAKTVSLSHFNKSLINDWKPKKVDCLTIKKRLSEKIKKKQEFYRYYGMHKSQSFFLKLLKQHNLFK